MKYNMLTIIDIKSKNNKTFYYCRCDCGNEKWFQASHVRNGNTKSCGCLYSKHVNL